MELNLSKSDGLLHACKPMPINDSAEGLGLVILGGLVALASVVGNTLVLLAFRLSPVLRRTPSNWFLLSLAVADALAGGVSCTVFMATLVHSGNFYDIKLSLKSHDEDRLKIAMQLTSLMITASSVFTICTISMDRFLAIRFSLRYDSLVTPARCLAVIASTWISSLVYVLLFLLISRTVLEVLSQFFLTLPVLITVACNVYIFKEASRHSRRIASLSVQEQAKRSRTRKMNLTVVLVVGVNFALMLPLTVYVINQIVLGCKGINMSWFNWSIVLMHLSSAFNPWIYGLRREEFSQVFKKLFHRR